MIVARIFGGLGNQMFQYALGRTLSVKLGTELKLDISAYRNNKLRKFALKAFNIIGNIAIKKEIEQLCGKSYPPLLQAIRTRLHLAESPKPASYVSEKTEFLFDPLIEKTRDNHYLDGYWQTEKYFLPIESTIRKEFTVCLPQDTKNGEMSERISSYNSISVHIRRGDYIQNKHTNAFHGTASLDYYQRAAINILQETDNPAFFVFSDDHQWVKDNIKLPGQTFYVDINGHDKDYADMELMGLCQHHIIANSTFSWWGAWLAERPGQIVVAPKQWFTANVDTRDLIPDRWVRL